MQRFLSIRKAGLCNAQHMMFMKTIVNYVSQISGAPEKMRTAITALSEALDAEVEIMRRPSGRTLTEDIHNADVLRDRCYAGLCRLVKSWHGTGIEPQASAARELKFLLDSSRLDTAEQIDSETGIMQNLLEKLAAPNMQAAVVTISATAFVDKMREANELLKALNVQRIEENMGWEARALYKARIATNKAYQEVTYAIEAYNYVNGGYGDVIARCNATISEYKAVIRRKSAGRRD